MASNYLLSGVQAVHSNNTTFTTKEGYGSQSDIDELPELNYDNENNSFTNVNPGMYKVYIDGTLYTFVIHSTLSGFDKLVIENANNVYTIINNIRNKIILYKTHIATTTQSGDAYAMDHSVNDAIDLLAIYGKSEYNTSNATSFTNPKAFEFISMLNIKVGNDKNEYEEYLFNMKNYLKSIDDIRDTLYIDTSKNTAMFIFKTGRLVLSGYEPFELVPEYSNSSINVYRFANSLVKKSGSIYCTHIPTISWNNMTNTSYIRNGICISTEDSNIYFKIKRSDFNDKTAFTDEIKRWSNLTNDEISDSDYLYNGTIATPVTLLYELAQPSYKHIVLSDYKIPTFFNKSYIFIHPYKQNKETEQLLSNIIGLVPKNGVIQSAIKQLAETSSHEEVLNNNDIITGITTDNSINVGQTISFMYFYKHLRIN